MLGVAEVATFLGLTERASDRLLVSNASRCAPDVANRDGLRLLCGSDFDALSPDELTAIAAWLEILSLQGPCRTLSSSQSLRDSEFETDRRSIQDGAALG
jgi:hypothetical protein